MSLTLIITDAGRAALVNARADGTNAVRIARAGLSATAVVPTRGATMLPGEIKRVDTLNGVAVASDIIHVVIRDEGTDVYTVRSIALYLDTGQLFAIYGQAGPILEKSAAAMLLLAVDVTLVDVSAAEIVFGGTGFLNPPATETTVGVVELATAAETAAGTDDRRAVHPKGLKASLDSLIGGDIWRASNDGAGSGLDADLLDGQQGSWYADIVARLGYTPVNAASYNGYEILAYLLANDGSGSGLDADLLDGQDGAWYSDIATRLGFLPLAAAAYTAADVCAKLLTVDGAGSGVDADLLDGQQGSWYADIVARLGYTPVNAASYNGYEILAYLLATDGSGSGLDADLLDGWHRDEIRDWNNLLNKPAQFPPSGFGGSFNENGYLVLPNSMILQWARGLNDLPGSEGNQFVSFPIVFPNACLASFVTTGIANPSINADAFYQSIWWSTGGVQTQRQKTASGSDNTQTYPLAFAIGY